MKNSQLLRKADLELSDLATNGGLLQPEQANTFIRRLIKTPTILPEVRVVTMAAPQRKINRIGFGSRILRQAVSATALAPSDRAAPTTDQIQMNTSEVIAEVHLPYDVLEDNIETATTADNGLPNTGPGGLRQTLIELIAQRAALDMEEMAITGDTTSMDSYLALQDGYLKVGIERGNVSDAENASMNRGLFKAAKIAMPKQYLRDLASMRFFTSVDQETEYRDTLVDRPGALGDSLIDGTRAINAYGIPVMPVPMMPDNAALLCNPKNLIMGIQRQISMEYDKDITARVYIIVLTARIAFQIEQADAVVEVENIGAVT